MGEFKKRWSASRISTYNSCPLKYFYTYVKKWKPSKPVADRTAANKGTCFHETVEGYYTGMRKEDVYCKLEEKIKEYNVDTSVYNERGAVERFFLFWDTFIIPRERMGFRIEQEVHSTNTIDGEDFLGILDLCLVSDRQKKIIIFDYKSAKKVECSRYKTQLLLYAYLKGLEMGWNYTQMADNIMLYIFFPFSEQKESLSEQEKMLSSIREVKFTPQELEDVIKNYYIQSIREAQGREWEKEDFSEMGHPTPLCDWCDWKGSIENEEGFKGCKASYRYGFRQERGVKYKLNE